MREPAENVLLRLIGQVYDAALDPTQWCSVIDAIKEAVGGEAGAMFHHDLAFQPQLGHSIDFAGFSGYDSSSLPEYEHYAPIDARTVLVKSKPFAEVYVDDIDANFRNFEKTTIFNEFFCPRSLGHGMAVNLSSVANRHSALSVHRHLNNGEFDPEAVALFKALAPHLARAIQLHRQATALRLERDCGSQALDSLAAGLIVVDRNARLIWANVTAESLLRVGDGLCVSHGRLATAAPGATGTLQAMIAQAVATAAGIATRAGEVLRLERCKTRTPLAVLVCPLRPTDGLFRHNQPAALVLVNDPNLKGMPQPNALAKFYGLTSAQADLVSALADGQRLAEYAEGKGISLATAKSQSAAHI